MGAVFRAEQISLKRTVALKLLRPAMATSGQLIRRFNAEAQAVAQLSHPNTVGIFDFGEHEGMLFIAMELIEGKSLRDVVHAEAPMPPARAAHIALQIAASLSDAHAHGIIHRDLKPDNVMLQTRGRERDVVRVLDFGIAKLRDEGRPNNMTAAGDILGTPQYIAPEQASGGQIDGRTDIYALGCLLYELLTARLPFEGNSVVELLSKHLTAPVEPPSQRRPDLHIPPALDALVVASMAKDPNQRPPTMDVFGEALAQIIPTLPPLPAGPLGERTGPHPIVTPGPSWTPPPVTPPPPFHQPTEMVQKPSSRAPIIIVAVVMMLAGAGAIVFAVTRGGDKKAEPIAIDEPEKVAIDAGEKVVVSLDAPVVVAPPAVTRAPSQGGLALPPGAMLISPGGDYQQTRSDDVDTLVSPSQNTHIEMRAIPAGADLKTMAESVATSMKLELKWMGSMVSAGKSREAAWFGGLVDGIDVTVILVLYEGPGYRVIVTGGEQTSAYDEADARKFFAERVAMP